MTVEELLETAVRACDDKKAEDIVVLDMRGISLLADYFVICHGNSDKQVQSIAREIKEQIEQAGSAIKSMEGYDEARWILVDLGDVVIHVFHKDERYYYNLEKLWGDAPKVSGMSE
jgi:iojap-related protein